MRELILIRGVSGSGKSTLGHYLFNNIKGLKACIEADQFFEDEHGVYKFDATKLQLAHEDCIRRTKNLMLKEKAYNIFVCNTFTQEWEMEPYFELAVQYGYKVTTIVVENRHEGESIHDVPDFAIEKQKERFNIKL